AVEAAAGGISAPGSGFSERQATTAWFSVEAGWTGTISDGALEPWQREAAGIAAGFREVLYIAFLCFFCSASAWTRAISGRLHPGSGNTIAGVQARPAHGGVAGRRGGRRGSGAEVSQGPAVC